MKVDFFEADCKKVTSEKKFGLYDSENSTPAIIKLDDETSWNATVVNDEAKEIHFTAIDHCIEILNDDGNMDSRCDVMLNYESTLLFVELKNKRGSWQSEGLAQIEATIKRLAAEHEEYYTGFKKRKAIVANTKHQFPCFQEANLEQRQYFMKTYKIRIQFEGEIVIN